MAGTINLSLSQQFDADGVPLSGGLLYFFVAGTTTPQSAFQDQALTIAYPNPIILDASGRVPPFFLADGNIKIRLTESSGVVVIAVDNLLVIGPSSGGGGGGAVDPTTVLQTGDVKAKYGTGPLTGFVRMNGRSIGSVTSGATELAAASAQSLFEYLWVTDPNLPVSSGRGATANADWIANKFIVLPDMRGRVIAGMDDMGNSAANILTTTFFGAVATTLGNAGGAQSVTLTLAQSPSHTHTPPAINNSTTDHTHALSGGALPATAATVSDGSHTHTTTNGASIVNNVSGGLTIAGGNPYGITTIATDPAGAHTHGLTGNTSGISASHTHAYSTPTTDSKGGDGAHPSIQPTRVMTFYIKL